MKFQYYIYLSILGSIFNSAEGSKPTHIILILADDLGFNDVGFHGSQQIPTPNIDAIAWNGVTLNNYYTAPMCTPSRASILTGRHYSTLGMQIIQMSTLPYGLPLNVDLMPQYLNELGYHSHMVGKWHLGFYKRDYTPLRRGFESYLGILSGHGDYYQHTSAEYVPTSTDLNEVDMVWEYDMRRGMDTAYDLHGTYATHIFENESIRLIKEHSQNTPNEPMFLYIPFTAPHAADYPTQQAPFETIQKLNIDDIKRRTYAAMVVELDNAIGNIISTLKDVNMLENSIVVFVSDNGGPAAGFNDNYASNFPLRGVKGSVYEGGVRAAGAVWSPKLAKVRRVSNERMHVMDWLPTLYSAVGGDKSKVSNLEGVDQWDVLCGVKKSDSNRTILHMADPYFKQYSFTKGDWKIINGDTFLNHNFRYWYGPNGRNGLYNYFEVMDSPAYKALSSVVKGPSLLEISKLRNQATVVCEKDGTKLDFSKIPICDSTSPPCLFNVAKDPCEFHNVAAENPEILAEMEAQLLKVKATAPTPLSADVYEPGFPEHNNYVWDYYGDTDNLL